VFSFLKKLSDRRDDERLSLREQYVELIRTASRNGDLDDSDTDLFESPTKELSIDLDSVNADIEIVKQADELTDRASNKLAKHSAMVQSICIVNKHRDQVNEKIKGFEEDHKVLELECAEASSVNKWANEAELKLKLLYVNRADLLGEAPRFPL